MAKWRHALALGIGLIGVAIAVESGGNPAALSIALGGGLSTGLGYWIGALLHRRRDS
jgi:drug/metabolite transporter (DMT)-like permease